MLTMPARVPATDRPRMALLTGERPGNPWGRAGMWFVWLLAAGSLALGHVVWRDEVRALTLALSGNNLGEMLWAIHGEGHPALWYLLLRAGYPLLGKAVLPVAAFGITAAATAFIAWRAPFRPLILAAILFGAYALFDYAVVARNYGMSFLLVGLIAAAYPGRRDRGVTLGVLLFLLCNTNVVAVMLAGGFVLFWAVELWLEQGWRWTPAARQWLINTAIAGLGVITCAATVLPPYNDAASMAQGDGIFVFGQLSAGLWRYPGGYPLFVVVLLGSIYGLARAPAAVIASAVVLIAGALFFQLVYPGLYRHQALFLIFLLAMYWLVANGRGGTWPAGARGTGRLATVERFGVVAFAGLLALQAVTGVKMFFFLHDSTEPFSRSRDLAQLLDRPALRDAVVMGNPDVMLEPLPFYAPNPIWLVRERRWGGVVAFTKAAMRYVSLGEMLATARALHARTGRPVVVILHEDLDGRKPRRYDQGYLGGFTTSPAEVRAFAAATRPLARFAPAKTDENYAVYLLTRS